MMISVWIHETFKERSSTWCVLPQRRLNYWFTQVYVDPYSNAWDLSNSNNKIHAIKLVQNSAIGFIISNQKGHADNVSKLRTRLQLPSPEKSRKTITCVSWYRFFRRMKISTLLYPGPMSRLSETDNNHSGSCQRKANLYIDSSTRVLCLELFVRCVEKTPNNY